MKRTLIALILLGLLLPAFGQYYQMQRTLDFGAKNDVVTDASAQGRCDTAVVYFNNFLAPSRIIIQFKTAGFDGADTDSLFIRLRFVDWWSTILDYTASGYAGGTGVGETINMHASFGGRRGIADSADDTSRVYNLIIPDTLLNFYTKILHNLDSVEFDVSASDSQYYYRWTDTYTRFGQGMAAKYKGIAIIVDMHGDTLDDTVYIKCILEYDEPSDKMELGFLNESRQGCETWACLRETPDATGYQLDLLHESYRERLKHLTC